MAFDIQSTTERLESVAGLALVGEVSRIAGINTLAGSRRSLNNALVSMFGLLAQGRSTYEEIDLYRNNDLFAQSLGLSFVPAQETLRLYLEKLSDESNLQERIRSCNNAILAHETITPIEIAGRKYIPVDVDVSTMDNTGSHKEGVSRTYMRTDGYSPIFSYIGTEGYMLDCELRPGSQHCQKGTPEFLRRNLKQIKKLPIPHPLLFRMDGGNDAIETIKALSKTEDTSPFFIIKRNLRRESLLYWYELALTLGEKRTYRPGKDVYTGVVTKGHPHADIDMPEFDIVFQVTERTIDRGGNCLLVSDIEVETWWTNMYETPESVIALYHDHGTSEQFHSELKSDMGVERLPSGKMKVNALVLSLAMTAFNTLRLIGQRALKQSALLPMKTTAARKRLRKVLSDLICIGCKVVRHGRRWILRINEKNPWLPMFNEIYAELLLQQ